MLSADRLVSFKRGESGSSEEVETPHVEDALSKIHEIIQDCVNYLSEQQQPPQQSQLLTEQQRSESWLPSSFAEAMKSDDAMQRLLEEEAAAASLQQPSAELYDETMSEEINSILAAVTAERPKQKSESFCNEIKDKIEAALHCSHELAQAKGSIGFFYCAVLQLLLIALTPEQQDMHRMLGLPKAIKYLKQAIKFYDVSKQWLPIALQPVTETVDLQKILGFNCTVQPFVSHEQYRQHWFNLLQELIFKICPVPSTFFAVPPIVEQQPHEVPGQQKNQYKEKILDQLRCLQDTMQEAKDIHAFPVEMFEDLERASAVIIDTLQETTPAETVEMTFG